MTDESFACTIVSVCPFPIMHERKPGIAGDFSIPAAGKSGISLLYVTKNQYLRYLGDGKSMHIPILPDEIAAAIVNDYVNAKLGVSGDKKPGLFWLIGKLSETEVLARYADKIDEARQNQFLWFTQLVELADDEFSKHHKHAGISDIQRLACKVLGLTREWNIDPKKLQDKIDSEAAMKECPACGSLVKPNVALCASCGCILDEKRAKELSFARSAA